jgi:hypothetical protein
MVLNVEAHSTALMAMIFKLSAAAQIQKPFRLRVSGRSETMIIACPAAFTLLGPSSPGPMMAT